MCSRDEQDEMACDKWSNIIQRTLRERLYDATGTGDLTSSTGSGPNARAPQSKT
jgi:hypothetical protein